MRNALILSLFLLPFLAKSQVTDLQAPTYKTVKIGNQSWMAENLVSITFLNGKTNPAAYDGGEWKIPDEAMEGSAPATANLKIETASLLFFH